MITMKGKYNSANIMIDEIDESTKEQIQEFLNHPAFGDSYIAIMPDCHAGKGTVIGFTMKMNNYIIPNVIGVDIGCGMLSAKLPIKAKDINLEKLDEFIKAEIPYGFGINSSYNKSDKYFNTQVKNVCDKIEIDYKKALKAIGSLGGGNHFIELGIDTTPEENIWITIHSGSRNFGLRVANYYQNKAKENLKKYFIRDQYKNLEFLLVNEEDGIGYLYALAIAQRFAFENRIEILTRINNFFNCINEKRIHSIHNYISLSDIGNRIIRKGATSALLDEDVIIPFNMRDGIAICKGKGNPKYNYSAPHGAGRILSRKKAKETLSTVEFQKQMSNAGIYTTTANVDTLDEAPDAYKDMNLILKNIKETVDVQFMIRPIYNFKAGGE